MADIEAEEIRRGDADDRESHSIDLERLAGRRGRSTKCTLPEPGTNHRDRTVGSAVRLIIGRTERAADNGGHAKDPEEGITRPDSIKR